METKSGGVRRYLALDFSVVLIYFVADLDEAPIRDSLPKPYVLLVVLTRC